MVPSGGLVGYVRLPHTCDRLTTRVDAKLQSTFPPPRDSILGCARRDLRYARVDGRDLLARVYRPVVRSGFVGAKWPAVVHAVGGGWMAGGRTHESALHNALAAAGIVSIVPDLRSELGDHHPAAATDFERVLRWIHTQADVLHIDRESVVIAGSWSGAHAALTAVLTSPTVRRLRMPISLVMRWPTLDPLTAMHRGVRPDRPLLAAASPVTTIVDAAAAEYFGEPERMRRAGIPELVFDGGAVQLPTLWITRSADEPFAPGDTVDELVYSWRRAGGRAWSFDTAGLSAEQVNDVTRSAIIEAMLRGDDASPAPMLEALGGS